MPRIAVLASTVADQIAAGEVVERPASVVKELVENALDAQATTVEITIEEGGRALIRVADDGHGMDPEDAPLALARHATSKIRAAADLVGVASFGFRGEALPAICSVSQLVLESSTVDGAGTRVTAAGGVITEVVPAARRRGTTVSVRQLFFNAPARQRFLRGARSEWRAIAEMVTTIALGRRHVRFVLVHDGKETLALPPASSMAARLGAIWGGPFAERLLPVDHVFGPTRVSGLVERPADVGTATRRVYLSVNGRAIRDNGLTRAAEAAYRSTIPAGTRPTLFLDLELAADLVDVNVHPAKAEVRFRDRWPVERTVETAVRQALGTLDAGAWFGPKPSAAAPYAPLGERTLLAADVVPEVPLWQQRDDEPAPAPELAAAPAPVVTAPTAPAAQTIVTPPLTQIGRTYLMFERDDGIVLIDQHSAHERILYERFLRQLHEGHAPSQQLLFPLTMHLGPAEAEAFERHHALFEKLGYVAEGFGGHTVLISAVPAPHPRFDAERCLRETLATLTADRFAAAAAQHERLAATVACKAAVKAGDSLAPDEMRALYTALATTELPAHDVHGRSTVVHLRWDEIDRRFGRT
ncbi:MAG: DNA mismatch repair endonuclease MutL [Gemmatimonadaceae bacterium]|nr:DNA mismatch repair endonuclease MutL [Gemmatimonadaceae bacterium]